MFKDVGYEDAITVKRALPQVLKSDPGPPHQPPGTKSETISWSLLSQQVAVCHQYTLLSGKLGASGKPDPKALWYQGVNVYVHSSPCNCTVCTSPAEDWRTVLSYEKGKVP